MTRTGFGRGLPFGLQQASVNPGSSGFAGTTSGFPAPAPPRSVGPLGGVVATAAERHVESDVNKGEFAAWRHLDPERKQGTKYVPGLHPKPAEDDWEEDDPVACYVPGMDPNPDWQNSNNNNNKNNNVQGAEAQPRLPNPQLVRDFRDGKKNPISALTEYW